MIRIGCAVGLVLWTCLVMAAPGSAYECRDNEFRPDYDKATVERALAQVYHDRVLEGESPPRAIDYIGTAFVIDAKAGLLLTAKHVGREANESDGSLIGDSVALRFPGVEHDQDFVRAKVLRVVEGAVSNDGDTRSLTPQEYEHAKDILLLQIEDRQGDLNLQHLRLYMTQWSEESQSVEVQSYFRASNVPVVEPGKMVFASDPANTTRNLRCLVNVSLAIEGGDSGAPVIGEDGFVRGIVIQAFPKGEAKRGQAVPTYCLTDHLGAVFEQLIIQTGSQIASQILTEEPIKIASLLRPSRDATQEWSNPILYYAIKTIPNRIHSMFENEGYLYTIEVIEEFRKNIYCPITRALDERRVYFDKKFLFGAESPFNSARYFRKYGQ